MSLVSAMIALYLSLAGAGRGSRRRSQPTKHWVQRRKPM